MRALEMARSGVRKLAAGLAIMARLGICAMMLTITYDVFARFAFAAPTDWAYPLTALDVLSITMLTVPYLYIERQHIAMDLIHRALPAKFQAAADLVTTIATLLLGVVILVTAWRSMLVSFDTGLTGAGTFNIPYWIHDAVLVITGFVLIFVAALFPTGHTNGSRGTAGEHAKRASAREKEAV